MLWRRVYLQAETDATFSENILYRLDLLFCAEDGLCWVAEDIKKKKKKTAT